MRVRRTLWLLYALFILYGGASPFRFVDNVDAVRDRLHRVALSPFVSPSTGRRVSIPDAAQNILLFLPFGALGVLALDPRRGAARRVTIALAAGLALSACVETLQLLTVGRTAATSDVFANTIGTGAGIVLVWQGRPIVGRALERLRGEGLADARELRALGVAAAALAIAAWQPFDVTLEVGVTVGKIRALQRDLWQFPGWHDAGAMLLVPAVFAAALARYLHALGERQAAWRAALAGIVVVGSLEASQLLIESRMPGLWDASVAGFGIAAGAAAWAAARRWPSRRLWTMLVTAVTAVSAAGVLGPAEIGRGPIVGDVGQAIQLALLFWPLGFFLGTTTPDRNRALVLSLAMTALVAVPLEIGLGWTTDGLRSVMDTLCCLAGGLLGALTGWRPGRDPREPELVSSLPPGLKRLP